MDTRTIGPIISCSLGLITALYVVQPLPIAQVALAEPTAIPIFGPHFRRFHTICVPAGILLGHRSPVTVPEILPSNIQRGFSIQRVLQGLTAGLR